MLKVGNADLAINAFWAFFVRHQDGIKSLTSADDPLYDSILERLHKIDPGLFFEFSFGPDEHELIITAEGYQPLFELVYTIIRQAPCLKGWRFTALKPQNGFPARVAWMGYTLDIAKVCFIPLEKEDSGELGIELLVPDLKDADIDRCHNALLRAIDYGLGEKRFAETVAGTVVTPLRLETSAAPGIPLLKLDDFIRWRAKQREQA